MRSEWLEVRFMLLIFKIELIEICFVAVYEAFLHEDIVFINILKVQVFENFPGRPNYLKNCL